MAGPSTQNQPEKNVLDKATELIEQIGTLGATFTGNPLLMAGVQVLAQGIRSMAAGRNIDTGPFDARMASVDSQVAAGRKAYQDYLARHGGGNTATEQGKQAQADAATAGQPRPDMGAAPQG
jgi:hypothetical protein